MIAAAPMVLVQAAVSALPLELSWQAPPECPSKKEVLAQVVRMVRSPERMPADRRVDASARIRQTGQTWILTLETRTRHGRGHRELEAPSCPKIAEAAALILALAIDPEARLVPAVPDAAPSLDWAVRPEVRADVGTLPGATAGLGAALAALSNRWRVEVAAGTWLPRESGSPRPGTRAEIRLVASGDLRGCYGFDRGSFHWAPCLLAGVGYLRGRGVGVDEPQQGSAVDVAAAVGALATFPMTSRLSLAATGDALFSLRRPSFIIAGVGQVFRQDPVSVRMGLGLQVRLP